MSPEDLCVELLASKPDRVEAMRRLVGAVNARDLRAVTVSDVVFDALVHGLAHDNPSVRFWSVQLLDHCPDPRAIAAIAPLLDDPVPRVRRNAVHALGCRVCKPTWSGELNSDLIGRISAMSTSDLSPKVRAEAHTALRCQRPPSDADGSSS